MTKQHSLWLIASSWNIAAMIALISNYHITALCYMVVAFAYIIAGLYGEN